MALPAKSQFSREPKVPPDKPRTFSSLFKAKDIETLYNPDKTGSPRIYRRADNPHALLYDISLANITDSQFRLALHDSPLKEDAHGVIIHRTRTHVIAEVAFPDSQTMHRNIHRSIPLPDGSQVIGSYSIPEDWMIVKLNLTHMPLYNRNDLKQALIAALTPYGQILEIGIYLEQHFFTGKGFVYLNTNVKTNTDKKIFQPLAHSIPVTMSDGSYPTCIHATWSKMPLHCRYCHEYGHTRIKCPIRPKPRCYHCQEIGHIRKNCPVRYSSNKIENGKIDLPESITPLDPPKYRYTQLNHSKRKRDPTPPQSDSFNFLPKVENVTPPSRNDKSHDPVAEPIDITYDLDPPDPGITSMDTSLSPTSSSASRGSSTDDMIT